MNKLYFLIIFLISTVTAQQYGLQFPSNFDAPVTALVAFQFENPQNDGLPIWGPNHEGVTYIWEYKPRQQNGYYTTFFWAENSTAFTWDGGSPNTYYGCHPYPKGGGGQTIGHNWEISGTDEGSDFQATRSGSPLTVVKDVWYTQAFQIKVNSNGSKTCVFFIDLSDTSNGNVIENTAYPNWGETNPPHPALTFGDAPWGAAYYGTERLSGTLGRIKIISTYMTSDEILIEAANMNQLITSTAQANIWWGKNSFDTAEDLICDYGSGRAPVWADQDNKAIPVLIDTTVIDITLTAQTPTFFPVGGVYQDSVEVSVSSVTDSVAIYYTTDGTIPTENSLLYNNPLVFNNSVTLNARAYRSGFNSSDINTSDYIITSYPLTYRVTDSLILFYDFEENSGSMIYDKSFYQNPMNLTVSDINNITWGNGFITTNSDAILITNDNNKLVSASQATGEISIEMWIKPTSLNQSGPARIVTFSEDYYTRNFTLGQDGNNLVIRFRTDQNNLDGSNPEITVGNIFSDNILHIIYTREVSGITKIYLNSNLIQTQTIPGNLSNWDNTHEFALANEIIGGRGWLGEYYLLAIYNKALSQTDVLTNYYAGFSPLDNALPIELIAFDARGTETTIELEWKTASETDNLGFAIERRQENTEYELISTYLYNDGLVGQGTSSSEHIYKYSDTVIEPRIDYTYRLIQYDYGGSAHIQPIVVTSRIKTKIDSPTNVSIKYGLNQNYPNPFNPSTLIEYSIAGDEFVTVRVYDSIGKLVKTLIDQYKERGNYTITYVGNNVSGVYYYVLHTPNWYEVKKMILIK